MTSTCELSSVGCRDLGEAKLRPLAAGSVFHTKHSKKEEDGKSRLISGDNQNLLWHFCSLDFGPGHRAKRRPLALWASRRVAGQSVGVRWLRRSSNVPISQGLAGTWMWAHTDVKINPFKNLRERKFERGHILFGYLAKEITRKVEADAVFNHLTQFHQILSVFIHFDHFSPLAAILIHFTQFQTPSSMFIHS